VTTGIILLIALALFFDFLNGFHDAANCISTIVATRVLTPNVAVIWAASFSFTAFLIFGTHVAGTIGKGIIQPGIIDTHIIFATLTAACTWNLITWWFGLPTSSSHALMGGLVGAAILKAGFGSIIGSGLIKILAFIVVSPTLGILFGSTIGIIVYRIFCHSTPRRVDYIFRKGQLFSCAAYCLGHGGNDAQKTMGIITGLLYSQGLLGATFHVPFWVIITCQAALSFGTLMGGWSIVKTMGNKITKLRPIDGFSAESGAAIALYIASFFGIPVSTTHTVTGSIVGVGSLKGLSAVKWGVAGRIVWAWIITIPAAATISMISYFLSSAFFEF
jgi:PiT family inorganic phosphate transporter